MNSASSHHVSVGINNLTVRGIKGNDKIDIVCMKQKVTQGFLIN